MKKWIGYACFHVWENGRPVEKLDLSIHEVDTDKINPFTGTWSLPDRLRAYAAAVIIDISEKRYIKNRWDSPDKKPSEFELRVFEAMVAERERLKYEI